MKNITLVFIAACMLSAGTAQAQSLNKSNDPAKQDSPGTTGAMGNVNANGVATDPGGVKAQQGDAAKSAPGTVGAAPGSTSSADQKK